MGQAESAPRTLPFEKGEANEIFSSYSVHLNREFSNKTSIKKGITALTGFFLKDKKNQNSPIINIREI